MVFANPVTSVLMALALLSSSHQWLLVNAAYPSPLVWDSLACETGYDFCATLEFCQDGSAFGYRLEGDTSCTAPGPLIRLSRGGKYHLTLKNTANVDAANIHPHGLHVVGDGNGDDITRHALPGECLSYEWDIDDDHPPGTYWYHAHIHGLTKSHVEGGAFGLLIVDEDEDDVPDWAEEASHELLLQISKDGNTILGNGNSNEVFQVAMGEWYRLRTNIVDSKASSDTIEFTGCNVIKVASDGVWLSGSVASKPVGSTTFDVHGASRTDFAIRCSSNADIEFSGRQAATLQVTGSSSPQVLEDYTYTRPPALDIATSGSVPSGNTHSISMSASKINGDQWNPNVPMMDIDWNEVHEWTLSGTGSHPFHLHLYHMLVVTPGGCGHHDFGEFYDSISASGSCTVRFKTADFGQRCIFHCHVLAHEDNGAMSWVNVIGSGMPENTGTADAEACSGGSTPAPGTPAPTVPSTACSGSQETCSADSDCCSNKCKDNTCKGNRRTLLRA